jgi:hypothetical protein
MSFSTTQMLFLQRLVEERPVSRRAGEAARYFCEHFSLGTAVGGRVEYLELHIQAAEALLRAHDLPVRPMPAGSSRTEAAAYGGMSEKTLAAAPHSGSIAVRCIGDCRLDGEALRTPPGCYLVVTPDVGARVVCQRLLLVENLETFRKLQNYRWIDYRRLSVLAVYRGDLDVPLKDAWSLVRQRDEPVWGFFDFDPAGLVMANALPPNRLERLVLPAQDWLREAAKTERGRQLYAKQAPGCIATLNDASHPDVRDGWQLMSGLRSAVTQERMSLVPQA